MSRDTGGDVNPPTSIASDQAAKRLGELMGRVSQGETFILTRYGKGVAQLGPIANPDPRLEESTPDQPAQAAQAAHKPESEQQRYERENAAELAKAPARLSPWEQKYGKRKR
jgi:antitoxin (DNA-binding transcriptional repressor) of toxin-antitoxin stability system